MYKTMIKSMLFVRLAYFNLYLMSIKIKRMFIKFINGALMEEVEQFL